MTGLVEQDTAASPTAETSEKSTSTAAKSKAVKASKKAEDAKSGGSKLVEADLSSLTVPALKEKLKERGLKVTGKKSELIDRLLSC